ncbi:MAG: histidine kinase [Chloroflexi bacterium]|nr:histidine kinase [Chloroflexota bacterium]
MRAKHLVHSLRFKITAGIALPLLVILSVFSYLQYLRERDLLMSNLDRATTNLGNVIDGSLQHAMLAQDLGQIQGIVDDISKQEGIDRVFIMNKQNEVGFSAISQQIGQKLSFSDPGCAECHAQNVKPDAHSIIFTDASGQRVFRNCKPIQNLPECQGCHSPQDAINGVLITDLSMTQVDQSLDADLRTNILWSSIAIVTTILAVNMLMSQMVVVRLERLVRAIKYFGSGDLTQRVPLESGDEIGALAASFNQMAEGLGEKAQLEQQVHERTLELERLNDELRHKEMIRGQLLVKVITAQEEERKRIARELHDQLAQALSAMSMGMEAAERALPPQLEPLRARLLHAKALATGALEQTHELILGLRPVDLDDLGLIAAMRSYAEQHLVPREVEVEVQVRGNPRRLAPELEITVFRIVQEAINNIGNHAAARHVELKMTFFERSIEVTITDDGCGFDCTGELEHNENDGGGLGLLGMQERATLAAGSFRVESRPGCGTRITIMVPTDEKDGRWGKSDS